MIVIDKLLDEINNKGIDYYVCECRIWYGRDSYSEYVDIDYKKEIGGELDYEKAFKKILGREGT